MGLSFILILLETISPLVGFNKPEIKSIKVVLPDPVVPTKATELFDFIFKLIFFNIKFSEFGYL